MTQVKTKDAEMIANASTSGWKGRKWAGLAVLCVASAVFGVGWAQERQEKKPPIPGPMLEQGYIDLETPVFSVRLVRSSQTIAALKPKGAADFDFTPGDLLVARSKDGYYHLGDVDLRLRTGS